MAPGASEEMEEDDDAVEDGSKPPRIDIKLTVPTCQRSVPLINYEITSQLDGAAAIFNSEVSLPLVPSAQAMYEEEIMEADISVRYGRPFDTVREATIQFARKWCHTVGHGLHEAVRLEFLSPDSYHLHCKPDHWNVPLTAFSLGSFRNYGVFDDHFQYVGGQKPIVVDFEHDSKKMDIYCMYNTTGPSVPPRYQHRGGRRGGVAAQTGTTQVIVVSRLTFHYQSIQSIVVDYAGDYGESVDPNNPIANATGPATVIYFRLKHPPKIHAGWGKPVANRSHMTAFENCMANRRFCYFERVRELLDARAETIGKCNVLKIILKPFDPGNAESRTRGGMGSDEMDWNESVNEILSRVRARTSCRVYYTGIRCKHMNEPSITISENFLTSFKCFYLLKALIYTRTYSIADQVNTTFLDYVRRCTYQNENAAEIALSQLLAAAEENRYFNLLGAFRKIFEVYANEAASLAAQQLARQPGPATQNGTAPPSSKQSRRANNSRLPFGDEEIARNCVKVRKLIVTPTRHMLLAPEVIVSNRVLRKFGEEYALRVVVRDEDGGKFQGSRMKSEILRAFISGIMIQDYPIGERRYRFLGWSNSQLRDHAFYMYARTADGQDVTAIRTWMGDFTAIQNVPKLMSRMGQCFTQAQTSLDLPWSGGQVDEEDDIMGGDPDPVTGELYNFSDGIGRISKLCSEEVCRLLDVTPVRSAYQIRYAGFKGMLSMDPTLDTDPNGTKIMLRKSMHKFESDTSHMLEIVKYSQPSPVYLNRPLAMILDQVSEKTLRQRRPAKPSDSAAASVAGVSENVHRRVCNRIHELLDDELFSMADMLVDEKASVAALTTRTTLSIDFKRLKVAGFNLTTEPFFRGMLLAIHQYTIKQQLWKQKIEVPPDMGRTMYGVLDTTKLLQYGQVYVQYSTNIKNPGDERVVLEGDVMVTKNPCIVPGDVRIFKAVKVPQLSHMVDVIVFPQNGPRPHTDEMAGSDLDGDEYSVYWDPQLMFDRRQVQTPMDFPKNKPPDVAGGVKDDHMVDFFCNYLQQDSIGSVSWAHLAIADKEGLFNEIAMNIAKKCSMAVDFPKTGVPAPPLTEEEKPVRWPDYFEKNHMPMYRSQRLVGKLYRRVKNASDIIRLGQDSISRPSSDRTHFDAHLRVEGWEDFEEEAVLLRNQYVQYLQMLLDQYGVSDEMSLISGHMVTIRNRLSDGEKEDFSFFNTEKIIEWRIGQINRKFRRKFFEVFGGESDELIEQPSLQMQQKASAWYMVTYGQHQYMRGRVMLSFPWMIWEILCYVKLRRTYESYAVRLQERVIDPTAELLAKTIEQFCLRSIDEVARLIGMVIEIEKNDSNSGGLVEFYSDVYNPDFRYLLAVIMHWAEKEIGFQNENSLKPIYIARLLIDYCLQRQFLEKKNVILEEQQTQQSTSRRHLVSVGDILLEFLKYLASFKHRETITTKIADDEATINLRRRQLRLIGQVAFKTYHRVAWTASFDSLHLQNESRMARAALRWDREEMEAITVIIDSTVTRRVPDDEVRQRLKSWSGVDDVQIRNKQMRNGTDECFVTAAGTLEARQALHDILLSENLLECLIDNVNPLLDQEF